MKEMTDSRKPRVSNVLCVPLLTLLPWAAIAHHSYGRYESDFGE